MAISEDQDNEATEAPQGTPVPSRLYSARFPLAVAFVVLVLASLWWQAAVTGRTLAGGISAAVQ